MKAAEQDGKGLRLRARLRALYHGSSPAAVRFRFGVIIVDLAIIAFFIAAPILRDYGWAFYTLDILVLLLLSADLAARAIAWGGLRDFLKRPIVWVDLFVLLTLLFPDALFNLGFLRVLRLWTLIHSEFFWRTVGRRYDDTRIEEIVKTAGTLVTFVFVVTGFVYTSFIGRYEGISGYVDALYFTVTSLTTTGYGDILLPGVWGRLLSIVIMLAGVSLFIRLIQTMLRPHKVLHPCQTCGLQRHDPDAVHCKACGQILDIPNDD
ncbi:ion channel [Brevundimonas sp. 2R-24]|uniref:Ion channel n=1 Tax=Peiella sedimenti TaxID=3061083 RepID=A0ABT8SK61_9CAUL|nr:ion channel [Caulobacteraceae bacterium XZ-24]